MNQYELGSWNCAVISVARMTRHSKNLHSVFVIITRSSSLSKASLPERRKYFETNRKHPKKRKDMLHASLSKKQSINIFIHWQDADSSSDAMKEHFPDAEIMICSGHAGKVRKENLAKINTDK